MNVRLEGGKVAGLMVIQDLALPDFTLPYLPPYGARSWLAKHLHAGVEVGFSGTDHRTRAKDRVLCVLVAVAVRLLFLQALYGTGTLFC